MVRCDCCTTRTVMACTLGLRTLGALGMVVAALVCGQPLEEARCFTAVLIQLKSQRIVHRRRRTTSMGKARESSLIERQFVSALL